MNELEYKLWRENAVTMLLMTGTYSVLEIAYIIEWFDTIKTRKEINLLGGDEERAYKLFDAMNSLDTKNLTCGDMVAHSMYARLFMYSPYIKRQYLKETGGHDAQTSL